MLNTYAPTHICWNSNSQGDGIRRLGIWEVIRTQVGALWLELWLYKTEPPKELSSSFHHEAQWEVQGLKLVSNDWNHQSITPSRPQLQSCEQYVSAVCKPPSRWYFVRAAWTDQDSLYMHRAISQVEVMWSWSQFWGHNLLRTYHLYPHHSMNIWNWALDNVVTRRSALGIQRWSIINAALFLWSLQFTADVDTREAIKHTREMAAGIRATRHRNEMLWIW